MLSAIVTSEPIKSVYAEDMDLRVYSAKGLKVTREEKNLSQKALAEKSEVSLSMIAKLEQDITSPTAEVLQKLGRALDVFFVIAWGSIDEETSILFKGKQ